MACRRLEDVLQHPTRLLAAGEGTDGELLQRYARQRDEVAFGALVRRHGPLVLGVSRRLLHHHQDAEDVFQATFAILAHKAASPRWQDSIAGWLYRVAYRLALRTKAKVVRQRRREGEAVTAPRTRPETLEDRRELVAALDEELYRLSDSHREPLLLCYLEGKTRDQAARQLGWSLRTLERRLEQGLKLLRARLTRRGVELPLALLAAGLSQQAASADVSAATVAATVEVAMGFGSGAAVSPQVVALVEGGLKAMAGTKLKLGAALLLAASVVVLGVGALGYRLLATEPTIEQPAAEERKADTPAPVLAWPEGTTVKGHVVDHRGAPVVNAEVLLLGKERLYVDADRRTWFMPGGEKDQPSPPSTRTNAKGEFTI
jgi:RNA polymerase sigma factor (sigma-70 family)